MNNKLYDIVLEGGGVKGIGLVGALEELEKATFVPCRVAGTSAGAIVGALLAAGMPAADIVKLMQNVDYSKFQDESLVDTLGIAGKTLSLVFEKGIYEGRYLRDWLAAELEKLDTRTFADLRLTEPWAQKLPPEQRYKLVIIVSDVSRGQLVRLPWDYHKYGLNPDEQLVADAVRSSMSIPYFYEPTRLGDSYIVDGGMLSNFPIDIFDNTNEWPTLGIKLSARENVVTKINPVNNPIDYGKAVVATALSAHDRMHLDDPCTLMRTIFVDTFDMQSTHFAITKEEQTKLYQSGQKYARKFLETWDFKKYKRVCEKKR